MSSVYLRLTPSTRRLESSRRVCVGRPLPDTRSKMPLGPRGPGPTGVWNPSTSSLRGCLDSGTLRVWVSSGCGISTSPPGTRTLCPGHCTPVVGPHPAPRVSLGGSTNSPDSSSPSREPYPSDRYGGPVSGGLCPRNFYGIRTLGVSIPPGGPGSVDRPLFHSRLTPSTVHITTRIVTASPVPPAGPRPTSSPTCSRPTGPSTGRGLGPRRGCRPTPSPGRATREAPRARGLTLRSSPLRPPPSPPSPFRKRSPSADRP